MNEEEIAYYQAQEDEYNSQHGSCPNCSTIVHISHLENEPDGKVCCVICCEQYRLSVTPASQDKE